MGKGNINDGRRMLLFKVIPSALLASSVFVVSNKAFPINTESTNLGVNNILGNSIRFNGMLQDVMLNMAHLGNGYRVYNQLILRFNGHDSESPFGGGGINAYAYCIGDPLNFTDPTGHTPAAAIVGIIAGTAGMVGNASTVWMKKKYGKKVPGFSFAKKFAIGSAVLNAASIATAVAALAVSDDSQAKTALAVTSVVTGMLGAVGSLYGFYGMKLSIKRERSFADYRTARSRPNLFRSRSNSDDGIYFLHGDMDYMYPQPFIHPQNNIHFAQNSIDSGVGRSVIDNTYPRGRGVPFTRGDDSGLGL